MGMKRARKHNGPVESDSGGGGYQVIYSGFVLILLCFFIMLSSFATMEKAKVLQFVEAFASSLSILPGGVKSEAGRQVLAPSADVVPLGDDLTRLFSELQTAVTEAGLDERLRLELGEASLVMRFEDTVMFPVGSADIAPEIVPMLDRIARMLAATDFQVRIEGHTDNLPIRNARFPSNWELSTARAVNVLRFFLDLGHIPAGRLTAVGFGEFQPLAPNERPVGRAQNRRVEIIVLRETGATENAA
jgi:chemotaxis protein MotB